MKQSKASWIDYIRNYRFNSVFLKIILLIIGVIVVPFLCILFISYYSYGHIYVSEAKAYSDKAETMILKDVEKLFSEFQEKAILLSMDQDMRLFFHIDDDRMVYDHAKIQDYIAMYKVSSNVIDDIYIYSPLSNHIYSSAGRTNYDNFFDKECIDRWENTGELQQYEYLDREIYRTRKENLCLYYTIQYDAKTAGVIVFQLNLNDLRKLFDYDTHTNLIVVGNDNVLYDSTDMWLGSKVSNIEEITRTLSEEIVTVSRIDRCDLDVIVHIGTSSLDESVKEIGSFLVIFSLVVLLITIVLAFYLTKKVTNPLTNILNMLEEDSGNNKEKLLQNKDEVGFILNAISSTILLNKNIEDELSERIRLLKKAQAIALQAQINPHFINNTLENINWMAVSRLGGGNTISEMLNCLSSLLRSSLEEVDTFITLGEEISHAKKYLYIQKMRFDDKFDVIWDIESGIEKYRIVKLVLQPIIENAFNYGIKPYKGKGTIQIKAHKIGDILKITVKNSGHGLSPQEVERINGSIRKTVIKESDHIGLSNVNQRLILAFGESYGVTVSSQESKGTSVTVEIPCIT